MDESYFESYFGLRYYLLQTTYHGLNFCLPLSCFMAKFFPILRIVMGTCPYNAAKHKTVSPATKSTVATSHRVLQGSDTSRSLAFS